MVAEVLAELGWPIDPQIAEALAAALLTDTGWLRYSNTDGRTLKTLARLLSAGGVCGAEGAAWLVAIGTDEKLEAAQKLVDSVAAEPPCQA